MKWLEGPLVDAIVRRLVTALLGALTGLLLDVGLLDGQAGPAVARALLNW